MTDDGGMQYWQQLGQQEQEQQEQANGEAVAELN